MKKSSFVPVLDRSADGRFQVSCEGCGTGLDWLTGVELTAMAIKGYRHLCFDCDPMANKIPQCFRFEGGPLEHVDLVNHNGDLIRVKVSVLPGGSSRERLSDSEAGEFLGYFEKTVGKAVKVSLGKAKG